MSLPETEAGRTPATGNASEVGQTGAAAPVVLDSEGIRRATKRMAHEIAERDPEAGALVLVAIPRGGVPGQKFEYLIRQLGFGLFPWSAIGLFALGRALVRLGDENDKGSGRLAFAQLYLLLFTAVGFALTSVFVLMAGETRFAVLAPVALSIGVLLDEALEGQRSEPVLGLLAATGTMVVARDFFLGPEELFSVHLLNKIKWPPTVSAGSLFLVVGLLVGGGTYLGLATRGRAPEQTS